MGSEGFSVRRFSSDDLNRVMEINFECLPENYSAYFYRDLHGRFPKTFLVAEVDGIVQGYIMGRIERGLSKFRSLRPARLCHVVSIAVREPYRRRGIATGLMLEAMRNGHSEYKTTECFLEVRVSNEAAIRLYEQLGFEKVKRHRGYYMDREDAWVLASPIVEKT